ncbi:MULTISPECIES: amidohydrolase [Sphingomonas]|nr:amidohydrolase [Sphingomonas sp. CGMCC 1.13658]
MRALILLPLLFASPALAQPDSLRADIARDMPGLITIYRDLHANPELSGQEKRTSAILAAEAKKAGFEVTTGVGGYGVVAVMKNGPGPVVMLRADMDALPVAEQTGLPFASKVKAIGIDGQETPVMHACGHDTHMTAWIETVRRMAAMKDRWSGTLIMIGQPAEEINAGASAMLKDGLFTRFPKPQYVVAFHDSASGPAGTIGYTPGYAMAAVDSVDILVKGVGGHGAAPATTKDPIVLAARIVTSLQTLAAREIDPQDAVVVTVGSIHGGSKHNIIPFEVKMQLTVRSYSKETRAHLLDGIRRIARGEAIAAGMPEELMPVVSTFGTSGISTYNDEPLTNRLGAAFKARFGAERVSQAKPVMVSEDFPEYREVDPQHIQSTIFWVGGVPQAKWQEAGGDPAKLPSLHSPFWAPDAEAVIATGAEAMVTAAMDLLSKKP